MYKRVATLTFAVLFLFSLGFTRSQPRRDEKRAQFPPTYIPPGHQMYRDYCAACHGIDGKGDGPVSASLVKHPPDLTTLAKRHGGKFPEEYVSSVLRFGPGFSAHGSSEMPVWGPIFQYLDNYNEAAVRQRIKNLCDYLESIQANERN
ncbi:MAG TPA: cytochrome c [Candidatus Methylomirabilis sp.]|nr:cytochrome c [Candidatus Methylomirabilis sp.]